MGQGLAKALKRYRDKNQLTQEEFALRLGISQGYVSRVEKGFEVSKVLQYTISRTVGFHEEGLDLQPELIKDKNWNFSYVYYPNSASGDRVRVNTTAFQDRFLALHCDAPGHDEDAVRMADQLVVAFETYVSAGTQLSVSSEGCYLAMNGMIRNLKDVWNGQPSAFVILGKKSQGHLQVLNAGMPSAYLYRAAERKVEDVASIKVPPLGDYRDAALPATESIRLSKGDVLFSFSDGFVGAFNSSSSQSLTTQFSSIAKALKGDAEGISSKLLRVLDRDIKGKPLEDNISFLMMSC